VSILLDDIARIIASPIPRRRALRLVGGAVGGAVAAAMGQRMSWAAQVAGALNAPSRSCPKGQTVCGTGTCAVCCSSGQTCQGPTSRGQYYCCNKGQSGCNGTCCGSGQTCCTSGNTAVCCSSGQTCCNGKCCNTAARQTCCGSGTSAICCSSGMICCSGKCCKEGPSASTPCTNASCYG
jgi:hypothetical protein